VSWLAHNLPTEQIAIMSELHEGVHKRFCEKPRKRRKKPTKRSSVGFQTKCKLGALSECKQEVKWRHFKWLSSLRLFDYEFLLERVFLKMNRIRKSAITFGLFNSLFDLSHLKFFPCIILFVLLLFFLRSFISSFHSFCCFCFLWVFFRNYSVFSFIPLIFSSHSSLSSNKWTAKQNGEKK